MIAFLAPKSYTTLRVQYSNRRTLIQSAAATLFSEQVTDYLAHRPQINARLRARLRVRARVRQIITSDV